MSVHNSVTVIIGATVGKGVGSCRSAVPFSPKPLNSMSGFTPLPLAPLPPTSLSTVVMFSIGGYSMTVMFIHV